MRGLVLGLGLTLSACCSAPQVIAAPATVFVAEVVGVHANGNVLVQPESGAAVTLSGVTPVPEVGARVYVTGALTAPGRVLVSSVQTVP